MAFDLDDEELKATRKLLGIDKENNIKGYSIQNGEPTPDNPVEIENLELNAIDIVNLKDISERFNNGTETIEDIINYCRNYELYFGSNTTMQVVEKKYFDKLVERIQELEKENRIQRRQLNSAFDRGWIPKEKVKDKIEEIKLSGGSNGKDNVENLARELVIEVLEELLEEK